MGPGSRSSRAADWTAIASLTVGLAGLCIFGFLTFFSGPIESAFIARLPCPGPAMTNDCVASHPESYRHVYVPGQIREKPGSYVPINDPGDLFHAAFVGSIITGLAALVLGVLALAFKSRLRAVAWSGAIAGGFVLGAWLVFSGGGE